MSKTRGSRTSLEIDTAASFTAQYDTPSNNVLVEWSEPKGTTTGLKRELKRRHMSMLAIGGSIGTGLFIASGSVLSSGGPGGALVSYIVMGIAVYFVMTSLGELATFMPVEGAFSTYMSRLFDSAGGFAVGWNYWLSYILMVSSELISVGLVVEYWLPHIHGAVWSMVCMVLLFLINSWSVKSYGEIEYWMAMIKVVAVIAFVIIGFVISSGKLGGHKYAFDNWKIEGAPFSNGAGGMFNSLIFSIFSFLGTEMLGLAAAESKNPKKDIPRAVNTVFIRIVLFYIGSILVIGMIIPWNDKNLLQAQGVKDVAISPFTLVFERGGLGPGVHIVNAVILITVISAGNSGLYACTRMLHAMAMDGQAPKIFRRCTKRGVPLFGLIFVLVIALALFGISFIGNQIVYTYILNISTLMGLITWLSILFSNVRFRFALKKQGINTKILPYRNWTYPFGTSYATVAILVTIVGQGWAAAQNGFDAPKFITTYLSIVLFAMFYFGWKYYKKTFVIKLSEIDLYTGTTQDPNYLSQHHLE